MSEDTSPAIFAGEPPPRVPLPRSPLVRVLCQVRFPLVLAASREDRVAAFQDAIRSDYPRLDHEIGRSVNFGPGGVSVSDETGIWRFTDKSGDNRISLSTSFMSIETTSYTSREDFIERVSAALAALGSTDIAPSEVSRVGVRYVDMVTGEGEVGEVVNLVTPQAAGMLSISEDGTAVLTQSVQDVILSAGEDEVRVRLAVLPPGAALDPSVPPATNEKSWTLDIDAASSTSQPFDPARLTAVAERLADRVHRVFRWTVTDGFLRHFGGVL